MTSESMKASSGEVGGKRFPSHRFWGRVVLSGGREIPYDARRVALYDPENRLAIARDPGQPCNTQNLYYTMHRKKDHSKFMPSNSIHWEIS